ncbi:MAG: cytochrome PufQ [Pseudomonadota bacterium]
MSAVIPLPHRRHAKESPMFDAPSAAAVRSRRKPVEYRLYYAIVFAVALPVAAVCALLPRREAFQSAAVANAPRRGVFAEARALTDAVVPFLFMG